MTNIDMIRAEEVRIREANMAAMRQAQCLNLDPTIGAMVGELRTIGDIAQQIAEQRDHFEHAIKFLKIDIANAKEATQVWAGMCARAWEERDMLARRVSDLVAQLAEANRYIRDRLDMDAEDESANGANGDVFSAIAVHQSQGMR